MSTTTTAPPAANEMLRVISERRAIRKYKDRPVDRALIVQVLDAARMAPSAMNNQPWHFYVLQGKPMIEKFSKEISHIALKEMMKSGVKELAKVAGGLLHFISHGDWQRLKDPVFYGAPVVVFITAQKDNEWASLDIGMCAQNMMLAAKSLGLDSCPVGFAKYVSQTKIYNTLHIPADEEVLLAVILGYGDETPSLHERKKGNVLFIE